MNEQIRNILVQETTKTSKIRQLYLLGVPRAEIARMVTNGNYGFVVNALRRMREREGGPNVQPLAAAPDYTFNRKFGIEIEAYNCSRERLARELREADIEVTVESYNHTTRPHWKLVTDSSINGNDTFELVSPILVGEAGLRELEKVCWVLDLCDMKVNGSCGLHVHIDAAGFSMETWRNLALSYKHLEPVIDKFMPASRRDNYYCRGLGHVSDGMIRSARTVDDLKSRIGNRYHKAFFVVIEHLGELELAATNVIRSISTLFFVIVNSLAATTGSLVSNLLGAGQKNQIFPLCNRVIRLGYAVGFPLIIFSIICFNPLFNIYSDNEGLMQIAQLPFTVALLNYAFALPGYVYINAVTGTGATRTTFIFHTVTIIAYQIYLWTISNFSTSLSVYWTAEYLYVILLGVLSIIYLKCKNY